MSTAMTEAWTVERFLAWEDKQEGRHEFDGTCIVPMTGGSRAHQRIVYNLLRLLDDRLDPDRFDAVAEMRLDVGGRIRYPDVLVCAGRIPDQVRTLRDAVVIIDVLSEDTAATDRETKRAEYARVPGMRRYLLLEQSRMAAVVLERASGQWVETHVTSGRIALPELGIELPLQEAYSGVAFLASGPG
jgi:Uma2 family endonuclease